MFDRYDTSFGRLLVVCFCPPLHFFLRRRIVVGALHSCIYLAALPALFFFGVGVLLWMVGFAHAYWDFAHLKQEQLIQRQATVIAAKMADKRA